MPRSVNMLLIVNICIHTVSLAAVAIPDTGAISGPDDQAFLNNKKGSEINSNPYYSNLFYSKNYFLFVNPPSNKQRTPL